MSIQVLWHGHSNFQIITADVNILIDPFFTGNPKAQSQWQDISAPDMVLVTHLHGDHAGDAVEICKKFKSKLAVVVGVAQALLDLGLPQDCLLNSVGFNIGGTIEYKGVKLTMVEAFHTSDAGAPVGYIINMPNGFTIYHAGDTAIYRNMKTWGELFKIDLALLPAGGVFTMDVHQAALAAKFLQAKNVIPMHWGTFPLIAQNVDTFTAELKQQLPTARAIIMQPGQIVNF